MFVVSNIQNKKRKFIIRTENSALKTHFYLQQKQNPYIKTQTFSTTSNQLPLSTNKLITKEQLFPNVSTITPIIPKIRKFRFKLSFVREPPNSLGIKNKKAKEGMNGNQKAKLRKNNPVNIKYACGRWKEDEHKRFIEAIIKYGNDWKQVQKHVRTRSSTQARSHAQKFFVKIKKAKLLNIKFDPTKASIKLFHELIQDSNPEDYEKIISTLTTIAFERNNSKKKKKNDHHKNNSNSTNDASNIPNNSFIQEFNDKNNELKEATMHDNNDYKNIHNNNNNNLQTTIIDEDLNKCFTYNGCNNDLNGSFINCNLLNSRRNSLNNINDFYNHNDDKNTNGGNIDIKNNEKELKYIFNALINHISNDELYDCEQFHALSNHNINEYDNYLGESFISERKYSRRKRSSFNSISGYFKNFIEDKEFKNM